MNDNDTSMTGKPTRRPPWNKGKLIGAKPPLRQGHVWSIRTRLRLEKRIRDLALFNLAIDSKLRGCDVVAVRVDDVAPNGYAMDRALEEDGPARPVRADRASILPSREPAVGSAPAAEQELSGMATRHPQILVHCPPPSPRSAAPRRRVRVSCAFQTNRRWRVRAELPVHLEAAPNMCSTHSLRP
jgi:hypothetical protein